MSRVLGHSWTEGRLDAASNSARLKAVRRMPKPGPEAKSVSAVVPSSLIQRIPWKGLRWLGSMRWNTSSRLRDSTPTGISPSPHTLSRGQVERSITRTRTPWRPSAMAAASPAGPPPATTTSQGRGVMFWFLLGTLARRSAQASQGVMEVAASLLSNYQPEVGTLRCG